MTVSSQQVRTSVSIKLFTVTCLALLAVAASVGYLGYSTITKLQTDQNALQSKYDGLSSQYSGLQANYSELQKNNSNIQSQLTNLQSQFTTLQSQQDTLQSKYSTLQANYTEFLADYQKLRLINSFSYLVFTDANGNYYAENGITRAIDYSGKDLVPILNTLIALGKTCYFLPGVYYFNSSVNISGQNGASISGAGVEATIIELTSNTCAFNITGTNSSAHNAGFSMSNIAIKSTTSSTRARYIHKIYE